MTRARTSETHPLTVAELPLAAGGAIGLAPCPGRQGPSHQGPPWERDLDADLAAIRAWGADALLCLIGVDERAALRVANLPDAAGRFGLTFVEAPLTEGLPPDAAFAARWAEIGPPLRALLRGGGRLLIHCRGGLGRSGTVAARLLVELGQDAEGAIATVRAARPGAIQTDEQVEHILGSEPVADGVSERAVLIAAAHEAALAAVEEAGALLRAEFHRAGGPRGRGEHADIDVEVEALLRERLLGPFPWGWCGEETADRASDSPFCWVVDPHDGTKAFLEGRRGSAVSVALLHDGAPVLGVVKAFACPDDGGDLIAWAEGCGPLRRNGEPVDIVRPERLERGSVVALSAAAAEYPVGNAKAVAPARFVALPSIAYRLALAAVGEVEAAVSLQHLSSWDVAAGHALLRGAGMALLDGAGRPVTYRRDGRAGVARCFGGAEPVARDLAARPWRVKAGKAAARLAPPLPIAADAAALGRAVGCLMGQLAGDALGSLVEFQGPAEIARAHPRGVRDMRDGGCWNTLAGQPTDDSELALALARALVAARAWREDAVLAAYRAWYRSGPFDVGGTTRAALGSSSRPDHASQSNGSLMRISPIGIFAAGRPDEAARLAAADSRLTHPNPVCVAACAAFAAAIAAGVGGGDVGAMIAAALANAGGDAGAEAVRGAIADSAEGPPADFMSKQGWVLVALRNAFHVLRRSRAVPLEELLVETVMRGGDTDTNGAIAGALLGARLGIGAIPARWRRAVTTCRSMAEIGARNPRPAAYWPDDARDLAEALLATGHRASPPALGRRRSLDLMTPQEKAMPMGVGALAAAERLGLGYLAAPEAMGGVLGQALDRVAESPARLAEDAMALARVLDGQDECWFAIDWFGPGGLGASLARELGVEVEEAIGLAARRFLEEGLRLHAAGGDVSGFLAARASRFLGLPNGPDTASRSEAQSAAEAEAAPTPPRPPRAYRGKTAHIESPVFASDLRQLLGSGRLLLGVWSRLGCSQVNSKRLFWCFQEWVYQAGMVMTDFAGPNFFAGPYRWIENPELAPRLMRSANLLTIRMYLHTMERAYRWSDPWEGFGAYETAFRSGGLAALLDRLALLLAEGDRGDGVVPFRA